MTKTKIIATYGPSISGTGTLRKVLKYADIVRINFAHAKEEEWMAATDAIRDIASDMQKDIAILADLPGPKVRIGYLKSQIQIKKGEAITFSSSGASGTIPVQYEHFHDYASAGSFIDIGDGEAKLRVKEKNGNRVIS